MDSVIRAPAAFLSPLDVRKSGRLWVLLAPLTYRSALVPALVTVPAGFLTDFASVPRVPLGYWLAGNTGHEAAVLHDWTYREGLFDRQLCDDLFLEALRTSGEPEWRCQMMYRAVRNWGAKAYRGPLDDADLPRTASPGRTEAV